MSNNTKEMKSLAQELEDEDGEPTGETHIHLNGGGSHVSVKDTGKFKAVEVVTRPENPVPPPPKSEGPKAARVGLAFVRAADTLPRALVAVALICLVGYAIHKGVVGLFSSP